MKKLFILFLLLLPITMYSQNYVRNGNKFVHQTIKNDSTDVKTKFIYEYKGVEYPIYMGKKGGCYIIVTSKKGKTYKKYLLKEITNQIKKKKNENLL